MTRDELLATWRKVQQNNDKDAKQHLLDQHRKMFPDSWVHTGVHFDRSYDNMHMVFSHIEMTLKK